MRPSYLRPRDRGNYKESAACPITKASNSSNFHIPLIFCSLLSQPCSIRSFFYTFSYLRNLEKSVDHYTTRTAACFVRSTKFLALSVACSAWMGDQIRIPRVVKTFFLSPLSFSKLRTTELLSLSNVVSSIYQLLFLISPWPYLCVFIYIIV